MSKCTLTPDGGGIAVKTPYDPDFVHELKCRISATERRWDGTKKVWIVAPQHGKIVQDICMEIFNELPLLPNVVASKPSIQQRIIDVRYIGATKDRGGDERTAYGWMNGGWNVIFSETVLRAWFDAPAYPDEQPTLYTVLGVSRNATTDEIKSGYRRMAKQWHTDVCKEPNAKEMFLTIQHAYDILSTKRDRYDAGLALEASLNNTPKSFDASRFSGYRSPLRCGFIMVEGIEQMGIFNVSKIFHWVDITDKQGRVLVVSWKAGANHFEEVWA